MSVGDYVAVCPEADNEPFYVARVTEMWEESGEKMFHGLWFNRGQETVLGETGDPTELFLVDSCDDTPLYAILQRVFVKYVPPPANWCELGGVEEGEGDEGETDEDEVHFFYQKWYDADTARFEDPPPQCQLQDENATVECYSCVRKQIKVSSLAIPGLKLCGLFNLCFLYSVKIPLLKVLAYTKKATRSSIPPSLTRDTRSRSKMASTCPLTPIPSQ